MTAYTLSSVVAATGSTAGGDAVTINGTNLSGITGVTFGGVAATGLGGNGSTTITCTTPAHAAGAVSVIISGSNTSNGANTAFTYGAPPVVSSLAPPTGSTAGGTPVTITGSGFTTAAGVTFAGSSATSVVVVSDTSITCVTPSGTTGTASVIVTGGSYDTNAANTDFTYGPPPTVSSVSPATGNALGSTPVTITGTNFTGATAVTFGGNAATGVVVVNSTTITCNTPAHAAGAISVLVTTPYGVNAGNSAYTMNADIITGWSTAGPQGAGTGFAQTVTTTVNSPITLDSGYIELVVDVAHILNKQDVIVALERIMGAIISDTWPPSGQI